MKKVIFFLLWLSATLCMAQHQHEAASDGDRPEVIIFMAVDCPITQKYMVTIKELATQFAEKGISTSGYFPAGLSKKQSSAFRDEYQIPRIIKLVDDKKHVLTEKLDAKVTPEVYLVHNNQVIYRGAIDNWFYELGRYRLETTEHYLIDAVNATLEGKQPEITETEALGCFIQRSPTKSETHNHH
ncbi:MAG: hypothetical protein IPK96_10985 [Flammeovirgaceae bacterium]|nr:hypothetical protein [Flammeovirgaceae bacterium]